MREKTKDLLYWNGLTRFFMEVYLDIAILAFVNLSHLEWNADLPAVNFSNLMALFVAILVCSIPILVIVHMVRSLKKVEQEDFQ